MTEDPDTPSSADRGSADSVPEAAALEAEIERTREDLAQTVDRLAARLDMKTRVRQRVATVRDDAARQLHRLRERATDAEGKPTRGTIGAGAGAGALAVALAALVIGVRRRRTSGPRGKRHR